MSVTEREVTRRGQGKSAPPPVWHSFPDACGRIPRPGDVAFCGFVKREPHPAGLPTNAERAGRTLCVVCHHMKQAWLRERGW